MNKPNFLIIGASKAATTSLWYILKQHPEIYMPEKKELNFFVKQNITDEEIQEYNEYFHAANKSHKAFGEASPVYSETHIAPWVPKNIHDYNPDMKLVYVVRHPYTRIESAFKQTLHTGHWKRNVYKERFGLDVSKMPVELDKAIKTYPPLIGASRYWFHLSNYLKYFDKEQIHVLYYEDFKLNAKNEITRILEFLGLKDVTEEIDLSPKNVDRGRKMDNPTFQRFKNMLIYPVVKNIIPQRMKDTLAKRYAKRDVPKAKLNDNQKSIIKKELQDDIAQLHKFCGKPLDFWKL
ncbi:MAG: sulfotransferase family protein [Candidatus Woesearchaeota archaeon]